MTNVTITHKVCAKCKEEKPLLQFSKRNSNKDGLSPWCKSCVKEYQLRLTAPKKRKWPTPVIYKDEIWADIPGFEGEYKISNSARVISYPKEWKTDNGGLIKVPERELTPRHLSKDKSDYLVIGLRKNRKGKTMLLHRMVALTFIPNPENKATVNHKDGNKQNNHVDNLEWATYSENNQHAWDTGLMDSLRIPGKIISSRRMFNEQQIKDIRSSNKGCDELGRIYKVHPNAIYCIKKRITYKNM